MVLHEGQVAEMSTGEGKTLVAVLAAYLNALPPRRDVARDGGVHVVTVNDYLAARDAEWMGRVYRCAPVRLPPAAARLRPPARARAVCGAGRPPGARGTRGRARHAPATGALAAGCAGIALRFRPRLARIRTEAPSSCGLVAFGASRYVLAPRPLDAPAPSPLPSPLPPRFMGLTVGAVQSDMSAAAAREAYTCDITYVTGQQLCFNYLNDHTARAVGELVRPPAGRFLRPRRGSQPLAAGGAVLESAPPADPAEAASQAALCRPRHRLHAPAAVEEGPGQRHWQ
jgi:hypothetical protein